MTQENRSISLGESAESSAIITGDRNNWHKLLGLVGLTV